MGCFCVKNQTAKAVFCAALGNVFWGFSFLFINVALTVVSDPYIMLGHRFAIAALVMAGMILFGKEKVSLKGKNWKPVALLLITQLCYYLFESYGILYTNSTISGLVLAVVPVVTIATGVLFLKEYPTKRQAHEAVVGRDAIVTSWVAGCDADVITPYAPCVVYGPTGFGAHSANERSKLDDLVEAAKVYALTAMDFCK